MKHLINRTSGPKPGSFEPGKGDEPLKAVMEELRSLSPGLNLQRRQLKTMRGVYGLLEDLSAIDAGRNKLRRALMEGQNRFNERFERFERLEETRGVLEVHKAAAGGLPRDPRSLMRATLTFLYAKSERVDFTEQYRALLPTDGSPPPKLVQEAVALSDFGTEMRSLNNDVRAALLEDEEAYEDSRKAIAARRSRRNALLLGGGGAAALALAGAALWRRRRKRRPAASGPPCAGCVIGGNYRLDRELGRGAMGLVFEATDLALRRKVAVKQLREELKGSPRDLKKFLAEARIVAALRHPHIVEIFAVVHEGLDIHLVLELVKGESLQVALARAGRLSLTAVGSRCATPSMSPCRCATGSSTSTRAAMCIET
ncbi:MAG: protein kinase [Elusimicrobia bacterium]|nr:protein kinase [Elusimicrobiota bacterium]